MPSAFNYNPTIFSSIGCKIFYYLAYGMGGLSPWCLVYISFERFIVCKNFLLNDKRKEAYKTHYFKIGKFIHTYQENDNNNISSIVHFDVPYLFLNKIDDINIIFGQQQLEHLNQVINVFKSKNPDEKLVSIKKKSLLTNWSDKVKTVSSTNIFLKQKIDDKDRDKEREKEKDKDKDKDKNCFL